jgi:hypothetical protein
MTTDQPYPADADEAYEFADTCRMDDGSDETTDAYISRVLRKAADALRNRVPATFTGPELDLVRHLMPAHEVHQSAAARWVSEHYGPKHNTHQGDSNQ